MALEKPHAAKQFVRTDSVMQKMAKTPQFLTLEAQIATEGLVRA